MMLTAEARAQTGAVYFQTVYLLPPNYHSASTYSFTQPIKIYANKIFLKNIDEREKDRERLVETKV